VLLFYAFLLRQAVDIPNLDDYDTILAFLNKLAAAPSISAKLSWFLASQNSEFKLLFLHGAAWLQAGLLGHIEFAVLSVLGNGFALALAYLVWKMFLPASKGVSVRPALFIPVPWLIFQLEYWDDLDWATNEFQHLAGLVFSLAAVFFLTRSGKLAFGLAVAGMVLGIASDGDGLAIIPLGLLILAVGRRWKGILTWSGFSAGCIAVYAYHYRAIPSPTGAHRTLVSMAMGFKPIYVLACMGGAIGLFSRSVWASVLLGILLLSFFLWMLSRGYAGRNPAVYYNALFLTITMAGVAGLRGDLGVEQSMTSRYTIYSVMLLVFAWVAAAEEFFQRRKKPFLHDGLYLLAVSAAVLFSLAADLAGTYAIVKRNRMLTQAMTVYEHPTPDAPNPYPSPIYAIPGQAGSAPIVEQRERFREELAKSVSLGIYKPPRL